MGRCMFAVTFCPSNIECNRGHRLMIFYHELVILECDSRHCLSCYFFRYPNLIRHHTICNRVCYELIQGVCFSLSFFLTRMKISGRCMIHSSIAVTVAFYMSHRSRIIRIPLDHPAPNFGSSDFYDFFRIWSLKISTSDGEFNVGDRLDHPCPLLYVPWFWWFFRFKYVFHFRINVLNGVPYISASDFVQVSLAPSLIVWEMNFKL